ncbi:MAG TPA: FAD:protein FMN transferase [Streptosporangiaceae bacterium]|nr:FAD:protein FMN transferase [Streptosporangiaceae bacterium]
MTPAVGAGPRGAQVSAGWTALGAPVQFVVTRAAALESGRAIMAAELTAMDAVCGARPGSELSGLGELARAEARSGSGAWDGSVPVSSLLADAIAAALRTAQLTGGDVDPVVREDPVGVSVNGNGSPGPGPDGLRGLDQFLRPAAGWQRIRLEREGRRLWLPPGLRLDLSATVTSWAVDRCAGRLAGALSCGVLVGLGGNIAVAGAAPAGGWRIRVQDARDVVTDAADPGLDGGPATVVAIHDGGLATSSTAARRLHHGGDPLNYILDPTAGAPAAPYWRTVSVAAACCAFASAASTAAMIRGRHAKEWLSSLGLPARMVALDGRAHTVAGWPACA